MKNRYLFAPLYLAVGGLLWMSASGGVGTVQQKDRTGSPVSDPNCTMCHSAGSAFNSSATFQVLNQGGDPVTVYTPGETYRVIVDIQSTGASGHAFQATALLADNSSAGTCNAITASTQISTVAGRWYFEHTSVLSGNSYEMDWTAPAAGSGDVRFYGSALAVDGNGGTGGDEFNSIPEVTLMEDIASSVDNPTVASLELLQNPVVNDITLINGEMTIQQVDLISLNGSLIWSKSNQSNRFVTSANELKAGVYFLRVTDANGVHTVKMMKN